MAGSTLLWDATTAHVKQTTIMRDDNLQNMGTNKTYTCLLCGRSKFRYAGEPHKCVNGYTKKFKKAAARAGLPNAFRENIKKSDLQIDEISSQGDVWMKYKLPKTGVDQLDNIKCAVTITVTAREKIQIQRAAELAGLSVSGCCKEIILDAIGAKK